MLTGHRYSLFCIFHHPRALPQPFWPGRLPQHCHDLVPDHCRLGLPHCQLELLCTWAHQWLLLGLSYFHWLKIGDKNVTLAHPMYFDLSWLFLSSKERTQLLFCPTLEQEDQQGNPSATFVLSPSSGLWQRFFISRSLTLNLSSLLSGNSVFPILVHPI